MQRNHFKRALCVLGATVFLLSSLPVPPAAAATDEEKIEQIRQQQKALDAKIASANEEIAAIKDSIGEQEEYAEELYDKMSAQQEVIDSFNSEIDIYEGQISALNKQIQEKEDHIATLEKDIEKLEKDIEEQQVKIDATKDLLKERLVTLYMQGESSYLELLLSSDSLSNFLTRIELMENITEHDTELISEIREIVTQLENDQKVINEKIDEVKQAQALIESEKADVQSKEDEVKSKRNQAQAVQDEINAGWKEVQAIIGNLESLENQNKSLVAKYKRDQEAFDAQIQEIIRERGSTGSGTTAAGFITPIKYDSSVYMSSPFGERSSGYHKGVDLTRPGATGTPIYAVKNGKVIQATYHSSYGNYVMIDHGDGVQTLYAHCSRLAVSNGQTVSQGQVIAYIGSTGNSTGPHLHFEVYINGSRVNPGNYIPLPPRR
ncbi:MAG: peptidoglycan DD-metalloendopeptidase family protein [Oscillospiraceae bacterium]|jgi:murein DD-endopeptidase MepM/ murein hydrolase activator NlpD|nr:peptidoglycan DD-metalloendopeptidase family protein [Oscillospiraceae bacterium]